MTWFTSLAWQDPTGVSLFILSSIYVAVFGHAGLYFWDKNSDGVPQIVGGLFVTVAVSITPVATYSLQEYFQYFPDWSIYLPEEFTVVVSGLFALYFVQFPFLTAPIFCALFTFVQRDLANLLYRSGATLEEHANLSIVFGGIILIIAIIVDRQKFKQDFAFWGYLYGVAAFWGGLTADFQVVYKDSEAFKLAYFLVNVGMMIASVSLQRQILLLAGGLGASMYVIEELVLYGTLESNCCVAVSFGSILVASAYYVDLKKVSSVYPFWGYLFGALNYWCGWTVLLYSPVYSGEIFAFIYFVANIGLVLMYIPTKQPEFIAFGGAGVLIYVNHLLQTYFSSYALPVIITMVGLALIALAVYCSGNGYRRMKAKENKHAEGVSLLSDIEMHDTTA